jgi:SAM-dependent methyltransferase
MDVHPQAARGFGTRAEEYERGRPGWPAAAIAGLIERFHAHTVLDLAAGTGKLTRILAEHASEVIAVEPLDGMRRVLTDRVPAARVLAGTAEAIPLPDASVDAVFVAEAFHWFDFPRATAEIARVLRPGGGLAVIRNRPDDARKEPWIDELTQVVDDHRLNGRHGLIRDDVPWREALEAEPRFGPLSDEEVPNEQQTDREGMIAMISSLSAIGALPPDRVAAAQRAARAVLERHGVDAVTLHYRTLITTTQTKRSGSNGPRSTSVDSPQ